MLKKLSQLLLSIIFLFLFSSFTHAQESYYDGMLDPDFINGINKGFDSYALINSIAEQEDGKLVIGGAFNRYNGIERKNILRINEDGTLDETFDPGSGTVGIDVYEWGVQVVLIQDDGKIIIGGGFYEYNGVTVNGIARLNSDGTLDTSFNTGTGFSGLIDVYGNAWGVQDGIIQPDGKILLVGHFSGYNGVQRGNVVRLNPDGSLDPSFNNVEGAGGSWPIVTNLEQQEDQKVLIAGEFTSFGGASVKYFARLNSDGSLDESFNTGSGANNEVKDILIRDDGKIFIVGLFTSYNGVSRSKLALINSDGTLDETFVPETFSVQSSIYGCDNIEMQSTGKFIISGRFDSYNGVDSAGVVRLNSDASLDTSFTLPEGSSSSTEDMVILENDKILLGGWIYNYNNTRTSYLVKLTSDGSIDQDFNPIEEKGSDGSILEVALDDQNRILIGGSFKFFDSSRRNYIARLNNDGSLDTSFDTGAGFNSTVQRALVLPNGKILITGNFTEFNGVSKKFIVRLHEDGSLDETFNSGEDGISGAYASLRDVYIQDDGKILISGWNFTSYNGTAVGNIARLNPDGSLDTTFNPTSGANATINDIEKLPNGKFLIVGDFTEYDGIERNRIAVINSDGTLDTSFDPLNSLASPILYTGGETDCTFSFNMFDSYGDNWNGGYITALVNDTNSGTYSCAGSESSDTIIVSNGDTVELTYTSGSYENENSYEVLLNDTLVYTAEAPPDTGSIYTYTCGNDYYGLPPASGFNDFVYKAIPLPTGEILLGGAFTRYNGNETNRIAVLNSDGSLNTDFNFANGFNATVRDIEFQDDLKFIVSGDFTEYNGESINRLARLNLDASLDTSFNIELGPNLETTKIKFENSGKIIIAGYFYKYNNTDTPYITRLLNDLYAPTGSIKINQDEQYSDTIDVTLNLTNSDNMSGVSQMMLCNNSSFTGCTWESYNSTKSWTLATGNGTKTVYVKFKDAAGNVSSVYSDSIIIRTPTIVITSIGQITNIVDKVSLKYYFTSVRPVIKGITQANSTVTFRYGNKTYTTQADSNGIFELTIENPTLLNGTNNLEYWSTDISDNKSTTRTLTLIIGSENFPDWLLEKLGLIMNKEQDNEENPQEEDIDEEEELLEEENEEQEDTYPPPVTDTKKIKFTDKRGKPLAQATIEIEGNTYITNDNGEIDIENLENRTYTAKIKTKDGKVYSMDILGVGDESESMVVEVTEENERGIDWVKILIYSGIALVILVVGGILATGKRKNI